MRDLFREPLRVLGLPLAVAGLYATLAALPADAAQRDCQTVVTCQFKKGGTYRGCLSSYTCRTCQFVAARCQIGTSSGSCRKVRCTWGG